MERIYRPSPTMKRFHADTSFVRALMGPFGSGKSVACLMELVKRAYLQAPNAMGIRDTKWAIVRNSYRELEDTTMETFFQWVDPSMGTYLDKSKTFTLSQPLPDGTRVESRFVFRALDKPSDIRKLLSTEYTGGFINEAREVPKAVFDALPGRLRYPTTGASWTGIILDTNPPDTDHWWYRIFEEERPDGFTLFRQPSGLAPEAENLENLIQPPEEERNQLSLDERRKIGRVYYERLVPGKDKNWINVYIHGEYGFVSDGKPVWPEYKDDTHYSAEPFTPRQEEHIYVGIDFGLTPAAVFAQQDKKGRWFIFDELVCKDMGAENFSKLLNQKINKQYHGYKFSLFGDPSGDYRAQTDEVTPYQILAKNGIHACPTYTNDFVVRREAVASVLQRLDFAGNPALCVCGEANMARKALNGGYCYRRMAVTGAERYVDKPDKDSPYSHVGDALQYALLGAGEGGKLIESAGFNDPIDYGAFDRMVV